VPVIGGGDRENGEYGESGDRVSHGGMIRVEPKSSVRAG
jgi:hypothetical protein